MIDLNQLLREEKYKKEAPVQERRAHERYSLEGAEGEFVHRGVRHSCRLLNVSMGGCCVLLEERFTAGALAQVEVVLPVHGMLLRLTGSTQWVNDDNHIGIRFLLPTPQSRNQLAALISCLIDRVAAEAVLEAARLAAAAAAAAQEPELIGAAEIAAADHAVHGAERRVRSYLPGEWPGILREPLQGLHLAGALQDLSLAGCILRTNKPFAQLKDAEVEIEFEIHGLPFRMAGVAVAIYNAHTVGIRFAPLSQRRREELAQLIEELSHSSASGPRTAAPKRFEEEEVQECEKGGNGGSPKEEVDDWKDPKIFFHD
jgi:hypothetical protein